MNPQVWRRRIGLSPRCARCASLGFVPIYKATETVGFTLGDRLMAGACGGLAAMSALGLPYWPAVPARPWMASACTLPCAAAPMTARASHTIRQGRDGLSRRRPASGRPPQRPGHRHQLPVTPTGAGGAERRMRSATSTAAAWSCPFCPTLWQRVTGMLEPVRISTLHCCAC